MKAIDKWDYAPEWANYYAMDESGRCFWHERQPIYDGVEWVTAGRCEEDTEYQANLAPHSLEARPTPITADALEAAGWMKGRRGYHWKTYRPSWRSDEGQEECSIRVQFDDGYFPDLPFMVWFSTGSIIPLPRIKTMKQLEALFDLVREESAPLEHATIRKADRDMTQ